MTTLRRWALRTLFLVTSCCFLASCEFTDTIIGVASAISPVYQEVLNFGNPDADSVVVLIYAEKILTLQHTESAVVDLARYRAVTEKVNLFAFGYTHIKDGAVVVGCDSRSVRLNSSYIKEWKIDLSFNKCD